eukprot:6413755-Prorocentrum_lima.AAC.1
MARPTPRKHQWRGGHEGRCWVVLCVYPRVCVFERSFVSGPFVSLVRNKARAAGGSSRVDASAHARTV